MQTATGRPTSPTNDLLSAELVRLLREGRPWAAIAVGTARLDDGLSDQARQLLAGAFAGVGLGSCGLAHLGRLRDTDAGKRRAMEAACRQAPGRVADPAHRLKTARTNLAALRGRAPTLEAALDAWADADADWSWLETPCGRVVGVANAALAGGPEADRPDAWRWCDAWAVDLDALIAPIREADDGDKAPQVLLEGIAPPDLFERIDAATGQGKTGFRPRVIVVQRDPSECIDALAVRDLTRPLSADRLRVAFGEDGLRDIAEAAEADPHVAPPRLIMTTPGTRSRFAPGPAAVIQRVVDAGDAAAETARWKLREAYAGVTPATLAGRLREAREGGPPLRVLIPSTRYSTFVRHAAAGLASAVRRAGHHATTFEEADPFAPPTAAAIFDAIARERPDVVISINYTRELLGPEAQLPVPWATWVQDRMPHLFKPPKDRARDGLEFVFGHAYPELFGPAGHDRRRFFPAPVVCDADRFFPSDPDHGRFACDLAYVSHHAETPADMLERLIREASEPGFDPGPVMRGLFDRLVALAEHGPKRGAPVWDSIQRACREALDDHGPPGRDEDASISFERFRDFCAWPLLERIFRHQTLAWCAEAAERLGLTMKVFGKGWDRSGPFAALAAGEVEHKDDLRACYASAGAHLHASAQSPMHQRVFECAASGGFPILRTFEPPWRSLERLLIDEGLWKLPEETPEHWDRFETWRDQPMDRVRRARHDITPGWKEHATHRGERLRCALRVTDHPALMRWVAMHHRAGRTPPTLDGDALWIDPLRAIWLTYGARVDDDHLVFDDVVPDPAEHVFDSPGSLEALLLGLRERPARRHAAAQAAARRVRTRLTHDAVFARLLDLLETATACEPPQTGGHDGRDAA